MYSDSCEIVQQWERVYAGCQRGDQRACKAADKMVEQYGSSTVKTVGNTIDTIQALKATAADCRDGNQAACQKYDRMVKQIEANGLRLEAWGAQMAAQDHDQRIRTGIEQSRQWRAQGQALLEKNERGRHWGW